MAKRLLDYDPLSRTSVWHDYDHASGKTTIYEEQDVEPVLERNKAFQNAGSGGAGGLNPYSQQGIKEGWWHVATIPASIMSKWLHEDGLNVITAHKDPTEWKRLCRKLADPSWKWLRTGTGRVG